MLLPEYCSVGIRLLVNVTTVIPSARTSHAMNFSSLRER